MIKLILLTVMLGYGSICHANGLIKNAEKFSPKPYPDTNGMAIGYGTLCPPHCNGITESQATRKMNKHLNEIVRPWMKKNIKVQLSMRQRMVMESLLYNVGTGAYSKSRSFRLLNKGYYERAGQEFLGFNKIRVKGKLRISKGLVNRRVAEYRYWMGIK